MNYTESIEYLESFWKFGIKLGLQRILYLLDKLGNPQRKFKSIHIAGTNGKGSVCAMTASVLAESGLKTGLYTSPHLIDYTERIKINGKDISQDKFAFFVNKIKEIVSKYPEEIEKPTEFEILTAAAFLCFAGEQVDIAVIEVGLGGRLDSTNVITPLVSAITNVELDHTEILGKTKYKIAFEKAGIIKKGVPVVTAEGCVKVLGVIKKKCKDLKSPLVLIRDDPFKRKKFIEKLRIPLIGEHQRTNTAVAVAVIDVLKREGYKIPNKDIKSGIAKTVWPARFQIVSRKPFLIVDGAHNPAGAKALYSELAGFKNGQKLILILGILYHKDYKAIIRILAPIAHLVLAVKIDHKQALDANIIAGEAKKYCRNVMAAKDIKEALEKAYEEAGKRDIISVAGSLFAAGEVLGRR